jgi:hypothetical protein
MKTRYDDRVYEVLGFHDGTWVWRGYGDSLGEGKVTLPQEVYDRLAQGITGEFVVGAQVYWIRLTRKELELCGLVF